MRDTSETLRSWIAGIAPHHVVLILLAAFLLPYLVADQFDPFTFIRIGARFDPALGTLPMGYDGQFAYQIARAPAQAPRHLDVPAYRYQRILYPLLARGLALGQAAWIPWSMLIINFIALVLGTWVTSRWMGDQGLSPWFSLAYPLNIGMLLSLRLDLTEPVAFLFVVIGFWAWFRGHCWRSAAGFALAALAKEVTLVLTAGLVLHLLFQSRWWKAVKWGAVATLPFALWQGFLRLWLGTWGLRSGGALASSITLVPYKNWWSLAGYDWGAFLTISILIVPLAILPAALGLYIGGRALWEGRASGAAWSLAIQALLYPFLPASNLLDPSGVSRFTVGLIVALLAFGASHKDRRVLAYSQLWILTVVFALGDNFVPGN